MSRGPMGLLLVASLLIVAGCGGTTSTPVTPSAPVSTPSASASAAAASASAPAASATPSASAGPTTDLVADIDIGGRTLHLSCAGPTDTGGPTVLLEAGFLAPSHLWTGVVDGLRDSHRVCAYDRAGMGQSQPATEKSRTTADLVTTCGRCWTGPASRDRS